MRPEVRGRSALMGPATEAGAEEAAGRTGAAEMGGDGEGEGAGAGVGMGAGSGALAAASRGCFATFWARFSVLRRARTALMISSIVT